MWQFGETFKARSHLEDNGLNLSKISKTPIQRKKYSSRVMQEVSWPPMSFDMAQEEEDPLQHKST